MSDADHPADAFATDAGASVVIVLHALAIVLDALADPVAPHSDALADAVELPAVAANAVADTVARPFNAEYTPAVAAAANRCVEPEQPVLGPGHERSPRAP